MLLEKILNDVEIENKVNFQNIDITNINSDSRKIEKNGLFFAINGFTKNGIEFIPQAIENGAKAIIVEPNTDLDSLNLNIPIISVKNTRRALAQASCNFYDHPSKKLKLIGVTGTKGKTTSTFMIKSILEAHGLNVGLIGSIAVYINEKQIEETNRTTPESMDIQRNLDFMVKNNVDVAIIEVSSQAMKLDRVYGCDFDLALFTNLSEDHISPKEHPNMEDYFNCKLSLLKLAQNIVINLDDKKVATIKNLLSEKNIKTFAIENDADIKADSNNYTISADNINFTMNYNGKDEKINVSIPGKFSIYNALGAITIASYFGVTADEIRKALKNIKVLGRSELVPNKLGLSIIIDYAHTPSSLESILTATKAYAKGKVIAAWGCGGDRDKAKRPIMGEISGRIADFTVLMSDNVRSEDPKQILNEIEAGIKPTGAKYKVIVDRTEGIKYAISIAKPNDVIVIPGFGNDLYFEKNGVKTYYNEREEIAKIIDEMIANGERTEVKN